MGRIQILIIAAVVASLLVAAGVVRSVDAKPTGSNGLGPLSSDFQQKQPHHENPNQQTILLRSGDGVLENEDPNYLLSLDDGLTFQQAVIVQPDPLYSTIPGTQWVSCAQSKLD